MRNVDDQGLPDPTHLPCEISGSNQEQAVRYSVAYSKTKCRVYETQRYPTDCARLGYTRARHNQAGSCRIAFTNLRTEQRLEEIARLYIQINEFDLHKSIFFFVIRSERE